MYIRICGSTCAKSVPAVHPCNDAHTQSDRTAHATAARRRKLAHFPVDDIVEEIELRQSMCEVF